MAQIGSLDTETRRKVASPELRASQFNQHHCEADHDRPESHHAEENDPTRSNTRRKPRLPDQSTTRPWRVSTGEPM